MKIYQRKGYEDKEADILNNFLMNSVIIDKIAMNFFEFFFISIFHYKINLTLAINSLIKAFLKSRKISKNTQIFTR